MKTTSAAMRKLFQSILVATLLWSFSSGAQQRPQLSLLVEDLDEISASSCGISKSSIESIAALTLRNNGIQPVTELLIPDMYVHATVLYLPPVSLCIINLRVSVRRSVPAPAKKASGGFERRGATLLRAELCNGGATFSNFRENVSMRFTLVLEEQIKLCLGQLDY